MRAVGIRAFGGVDIVENLNIEPRLPGDGEVRVLVRFAGLNPIDTHVRKGAFLGREGREAWPLVLGYEGAGEVEQVGPGVTSLKAGDRVAWCGLAGSQAELAIVPEWRLMPIPAAVPMDVAVALQLDGLLAHALSVSVFPLKEGDRVLMQGATEPASQLLIQIAKAQGATVIATVNRAIEAGAPKAAGADHVLAIEGGRIGEQVRELTGGLGCHVVYDAIGRTTFASSLAACARRGVLALYGGTSGPVEPVAPEMLAAAGSIFLTRPHLGDFLQTREEIAWRMGDLLTAWSHGGLKVEIGRYLPLEGAREGHIALDAGTATGKILVKI